MEIRQQSFNFPALSGSGPQTAEARISFPRSIVRATAGMSGYSATFENHEDHHFGRLTVELSSQVSSDDDTVLVVNGSFGLRDWSGEWDDPYSGNIEFVVLAELVGVVPPPPGQPRGDLIVVDAERTQGIQHFRSDRHLDSANVFPDNAIRLVADKATVVRLYVDYDANSGLPAIASLTGTLDLTGPSGATSSLGPIENIAPRRDSQIARGQLSHTLNFLIPEDLCRGDVSMRARVSDALDPTQFSGDFVRTLSFDTIPALPVIAVGINYTGPDVKDGATPDTLAAPVQADFVDTLQFPERLYPIPQATITAFLTMDYKAKVKSDINEGCDKLDDLLDAVRDMRGDSEDIVLGLFNTGVETGSVGGCGGDSAAVGRKGNGGTAAHELGHALGRRHAPCDNVTRCDTPANTDDNYPRYSGFDSDSIGEYGFDTFNLSIKDPGDTHDMMGYSGNKWISPYNYKALMSRIPDTFGGASGAAAFSLENPAQTRERQDRGDWIKIKQPKLFLKLTIERDRTVTLRPSFHFPAYPQARGDRPTDFVAELQDEHGKALKRACLFASSHGGSCGCAHGLWPMRIRQAMAFDEQAARLVIYECDDEIFHQEITKAPAVRIEVSGADDPGQAALTVRWSVDGEDGHHGQFWYLVQWRDARGTWRGAGPRSQELTLQVPKSLFGRSRQVAVRVLATRGIATGEAVWSGDLTPPEQAQDSGSRLALVGVPAGSSGAHAIPPFLRAALTGGAAQPGLRSDVRWYNSRGAEIARGRTLDLRQLHVGMHAIHAVAFDTGQGRASALWTVEVQRSGRFVLHLPRSKDSKNSKNNSRVKE